MPPIEAMPSVDAPALDRIRIDALVVTTVVGVLPHEREIPQPLRIDLVISTDLSAAGISDDLGDTINYGAVAESVARVVRTSSDLLLERVAHRVAEVVLGFEGVEAVEVSITKMRPPIPEQLDSTAVQIRRHRVAPTAPREPTVRHRALVALGSNLGDRIGYLRFAISRLGVAAGTVTATSGVYETAPVGGPEDQGPYLNMVVAVETVLDPFELLRRCRAVESAAGRQREVLWGPRTLDVDLVIYDGVRVDSEELTLPHPRYAERRFVLAPLSEIAPEHCPVGWDQSLPPDPVVRLGSLDELSG